VNLAFLGDALDHWKGSLIESLQNSNLLSGFAVDPMAVDWSAWQPDDVLAFARLLRINKSQIISHSVHITNRNAYFGEIRHNGDLFLDPDTGIATGRVQNICRYIKPTEIDKLLYNSDRLVAVYQHVRARVTSQRIDEVCHVLNGEIVGLQWCSYESSTVAMMFLSLSPVRVAKVAMHFRNLLGQDASRRIRGAGCTT